MFFVFFLDIEHKLCSGGTGNRTSEIVYCTLADAEISFQGSAVKLYFPLVIFANKLERFSLKRKAKFSKQTETPP